MSTKAHTVPYISNYDYGVPFPAIILKIVNPKTQAAITDVFLVDSGADISSIKQEIIDELDLEYGGIMLGSTATGKDDVRFTATVRIETPWQAYEPVKVIVEPGTDENLLGRNLINKWKVTLDGPNQQMTIEV